MRRPHKIAWIGGSLHARRIPTDSPLIRSRVSSVGSLQVNLTASQHSALQIQINKTNVTSWETSATRASQIWMGCSRSGSIIEWLITSLQLQGPDCYDIPGTPKLQGHLTQSPRLPSWHCVCFLGPFGTVDEILRPLRWMNPSEQWD